VRGWVWRESSAIGFGTSDRPDVTELPGLTSDPIYTADRRGGILISSGPKRMSERVLNPSSRHPTARRDRDRSRTFTLFRSGEDRFKPVEPYPSRHSVAHPEMPRWRVAWPEVSPSFRRSWVRSDRVRATRSRGGAGRTYTAGGTVAGRKQTDGPS